MKIFELSVILFALSFSAGCSSSSDSKPNTPAATPAPGQVDNRGADNEFDRDAMGTWLTTSCYSSPNSIGTMQRMVIVRGHGKLSVTDIKYSSGNCTGVSEAMQATDYDYTINNYAHGGGEISINGEPADVIINGNKLTWNSAGNSTEFTRTN